MFGTRHQVLTIDGMDQAKFRMPRNLALTKQFEKAWRPQEHLVAVVADGVANCFFLMSLGLRPISSWPGGLTDPTTTGLTDRIPIYVCTNFPTRDAQGKFDLWHGWAQFTNRLF